MTDHPYWGIAAIQIWICTRDLSYVQRRLTGDARQDEEQIHSILAEFECNEGYEKRSLVVSEKQAKTELFAKLRCGDLQAQGIKFDPFNTGQPVSDTFQDIPAIDWSVLKIHLFPYDFGGRYVASYGHNWWRHVVCSGVTVRQLWPVEPGSEMALSEEKRVARRFLQSWEPKPRREGGDPWYGAKSDAVRHIVETFGGLENTVSKGPIGQFISSEVNRLRKQKLGG
jgi:hypothetical protein